MQCYVYKSLKKYDTYLYIIKKDDFSGVPDALMKLFGPNTFIMEFDISQREKLGREDISTVQDNLSRQGYHLQMPETIPEGIPKLQKH